MKLKNFFKKNEKKIPIPHVINENKLLDGKVALISGGSGGIGFSIAKSFIEHGAQVILMGRKEDVLKKAIATLGSNASFLVTDVSDIGNLKKNVMTLFVEKNFSILVNSAGSHATQSFLDTTEEQFDSVMNTNLKGTYFLSQIVASLWIDNNIQGHILNVSSASAIRPGWSPYELSKNAIESLTRGMADILISKNIIVNAIAPGPVATQMLGFDEGDSISFQSNPSKRVVMPDEIAQWATYLVSDLGNYVVGSSFYITGGGGFI